MMCMESTTRCDHCIGFFGLGFPFFAFAHFSRIVSGGHLLPGQSTSTIVIGFVGGFISHTNAVHGGVQLAERLRKEYLGHNVTS